MAEERLGRTQRPGRARSAATWTLLGLLAAAPALSPVARAAGTELPAFTRVVGGPGKAETYPSGLEIAPDGTVVVADTGNDRVRKYRSDGTLLWSVGTNGSGTNQFHNPRDIGVDGAGRIYVADNTNRRIVKLAGDGSWLGAINGSQSGFGAPIGVTVRGNRIYVPDAPNNRLVVLTLAGQRVQTVTNTGGSCAFSRPRDVDVDAAGNFYVANYLARNVVKLAPDGRCLTQWGSQTTGPGSMRNTYGVRVAPDPVLGVELVYVADAGNSRLAVFRTDGTFVGGAGGPGTSTQPGTFTELRRVAVAVDGSGDLWSADMWGNRIQRFARTTTGWTFAASIADTPAPLRDDAAFNEPGGVAFDSSGGAVVVDTVNQRLVRIDPAGHVLGACGQRGYANGEFNWPRDAAIDPGRPRHVWVADTKQSRLQIVDPLTCDPTGHRRIGSKGSGPDEFNWPHGIAIRPDGTTWVTDTNNNRVKVISVATGATVATYGSLGSAWGRFNQPTGIAVDPRTGEIHVADTGNHRVVVLAGGDATAVRTVRILTGGFTRPEGVAVDTAGRVYVADTGRDRVVVLHPDGSAAGTLGAPGGFDRPGRVAVRPDGTVHVSDTGHHRVVVFEGAGAPPPVGPDTEPPDATITTPADGETVHDVPVLITGAAVDDRGIDRVLIAVQDRVTRRWWHADGTWGSYRAYAAALQNPGAADTAWTYRWTPPPGGGSFGVLVNTFDAAGNQDGTRPWRPFTVG